MKDGKPVPHLMSYRQVFNSRTLPDHEGDSMITMESNSPKRIIDQPSWTPAQTCLPARPIFRLASLQDHSRRGPY